MSSQNLELTRRERRLEAKKLHSRYSFLLIYPNAYHVGMSCLGFQHILALVDSVPEWHSERAFLGCQRSLETGRFLGDFDVVAFSVPYELDYLSIPPILASAGLPPHSRDRSKRHPFILAGGAALAINPEPVADFDDLVVPGEAEEVLPFLLQAIEGVLKQPREEQLRNLARVEGVYVPRGYRLIITKSSVRLRPEKGFPRSVSRPIPACLEQFPAFSRVITPATVFSNRVLVEIGRGCGRGCRFCAAGYLYRPVRCRKAEAVLELCRGIGDRAAAFGLISSAVSDHPEIISILEGLLASGFKASVSSLRVETATPRLIELLASLGQETVTLAPEAGSAGLRKMIKKDVPDDLFLDVLEQAHRCGFSRAKLYFLVGLPRETDRDLDQLVFLAERAAKVIPLGVSICPFVPKPGTPFQWVPQALLPELRAKLRYLRSRLDRRKGLKVETVSARESFRQAILDRGDRRLGALMEKGDWRRAAELFPPSQAPDWTRESPPVFLGSGLTVTAIRREYRSFLNNG